MQWEEQASVTLLVSENPDISQKWQQQNFLCIIYGAICLITKRKSTSGSKSDTKKFLLLLFSRYMKLSWY